MTTTGATPIWWPQVRETARAKRRFAGLMLDLAVPIIEGDTLHLAFARPGAADHFNKPSSGLAQLLGATLREHGIDVTIVAA